MSKIVPSKPFLIIMYGYPGSGKTYFARQFAEEYQVANLQSDRIRAELFEEPKYDQSENNVVAQLMDYMSEEFLSAGLSVIYDANAMRSTQRKALSEIARRNGAIPLIVWFQVDIESAFTRNIKRDRRKSDDHYAAGWDRTTFESIVSYMQNPDQKEQPVVISGKHYYSTQRNALVSKLREVGVITSKEYTSVLPKPGMVNLVPNQGRIDMTRRNVIIR